MRSCEQFTMRINAGYRERRDILLPALQKIGIEARPPRATFYVWGKVPGDMGSAAFAEQLLLKCGILAAPGVAFGKYGEGGIRFSLTLPTERVREAVHRLSNTRF